MASSKLAPNDPRIQHKFANLNGLTYHYLLAEPTGPPRATIFLIHGWPDFSFGWRYQIPFLLSLNLRVVAPDMMGYNSTAAPHSLEFYTLKRAADDMAELARQLNAPHIILLGHDWGGAIVYRIALWQPQLVTAVIAICTPYTRPNPENVNLADMVATTLPNFAYQLQLASGEVEKNIGMDKAKIKQFLNSLYGARSPTGELGFVVTKGAIFENLPKLTKTKLLSEEELEYYAESYAINGLRGTLNWYRTRDLNWRDEKVFCGEDGKQETTVQVQPPTMFVLAEQDAALPPFMSRGMEKNFVDLTRTSVNASHWCLWQVPDECNKIIGDYLQEKVFGGKTKL